MISDKYIDHFFLLLNPLNDVNDSVKLYINLAVSMNLSMITIISSIDLSNKPQLEQLIKDYKICLKSSGYKKAPLVVNSDKDISLFSRNIDEAIHPIFLISSKTGEGLDLLINFLSMIPFRTPSINLSKNDTQVDIHEHFSNIEKKILVGGIVSKGSCKLGDQYYLGPDKFGLFKLVEVDGIHCKKIPSKKIYQGQFATLSLKSKYYNS